MDSQTGVNYAATCKVNCWILNQFCVCVFYAWNTHGILIGNTVNYTGYEVSDQEPWIEKLCIDLRGRCILTVSF